MRPTAYFIFVLAFVTFFKNSYPHYEERTAKRNRDKEDEFDPLNYDWNEWDNDGENTVGFTENAFLFNSMFSYVKRIILSSNIITPSLFAT